MPENTVMNYVEADAPAGMTLIEWRRARLAAATPRRRRIRFTPPRIRPAFAF